MSQYNQNKLIKINLKLIDGFKFLRDVYLCSLQPAACSLTQRQENSPFPFFGDQSLIAGQTTVVFVDRVKTP